MSHREGRRFVNMNIYVFLLLKAIDSLLPLHTHLSIKEH